MSPFIEVIIATIELLEFIAIAKGETYWCPKESFAVAKMPSVMLRSLAWCFSSSSVGVHSHFCVGLFFIYSIITIIIYKFIFDLRWLRRLVMLG